jgi:hypothetical protein
MEEAKLKHEVIINYNDFSIFCNKIKPNYLAISDYNINYRIFIESIK